MNSVYKPGTRYICGINVLSDAEVAFVGQSGVQVVATREELLTKTGAPAPGAPSFSIHCLSSILIQCPAESPPVVSETGTSFAPVPTEPTEPAAVKVLTALQTCSDCPGKKCDFKDLKVHRLWFTLARHQRLTPRRPKGRSSVGSSSEPLRPIATDQRRT